MAELAAAESSQKYEPFLRPWHPRALFQVHRRLPRQPLFSKVDVKGLGKMSTAPLH